MDKDFAYTIVAIAAIINVLCWYLAITVPTKNVKCKVLMCTYVSIMTLCVITLGALTYEY